MVRIEAFGDTHGAIACQPSLSICCPMWFVQGMARRVERMKRPVQLSGLGMVCEIEMAIFFRCFCIRTQSFSLSLLNTVCFGGSVNEWLYPTSWLLCRNSGWPRNVHWMDAWQGTMKRVWFLEGEYRRLLILFSYRDLTANTTSDGMIPWSCTFTVPGVSPCLHRLFMHHRTRASGKKLNRRYCFLDDRCISLYSNGKDSQW